LRGDRSGVVLLVRLKNLLLFLFIRVEFTIKIMVRYGSFEDLFSI
jgi:hypothetical protein